MFCVVNLHFTEDCPFSQCRKGECFSLLLEAQSRPLDKEAQKVKIEVPDVIPCKPSKTFKRSFGASGHFHADPLQDVWKKTI